MKCAHFLHIHNKCMLCERDCIKFPGRIARHSFLENNFAEFLDEARIKINQDFVQSLVAFCYSNHLLFVVVYLKFVLSLICCNLKQLFQTNILEWV